MNRCLLFRLCGGKQRGRETRRVELRLASQKTRHELIEEPGVKIACPEGRVVEQGTAKELLSRDGLLYQLYVAAMGPKTKEIATYIARV